MLSPKIVPMTFHQKRHKQDSRKSHIFFWGTGHFCLHMSPFFSSVSEVLMLWRQQLTALFPSNDICCQQQKWQTGSEFMRTGLWFSNKFKPYCAHACGRDLTELFILHFQFNYAVCHFLWRL